MLSKGEDGGSMEVEASGLAVGLPAGLMGNSEVGHYTIGTGRVTFQDIVAINFAVEKKTLSSRSNLMKAFQRAKNGNGRFHFLGLVSDGGVHSHINHLFALLEEAKKAEVPKAFIHFFSDGRDTSPTSGVQYVEQLQKFLADLGYGSLSTLTGRYYAMDRDKRHERIKLAYEGLVQGIGEDSSPDQLISIMNKRYNMEGSERQTDEFMKPIIVNKEGLVQDGDTMMFIDFRADRMRQIVEAFGLQRQFETHKIVKDLHITTMTEYKKDFPFDVVFAPEIPLNCLAEWLSKKSIPQFHCAETEKYAHVTFFFNGGLESAFELEDRVMVPSPKVATYNLKPEMSCEGVAQAMVTAMRKGTYPFVMCNLAPPDMVGHTGVYDAAVLACIATDKAIGMIEKACTECGYILLVTADHGNAETMIDKDGKPVTKHTTNKVPFYMSSSCSSRKFRAAVDPGLSDIAPTILDFMGLDIPQEMTGKSLLLD